LRRKLYSVKRELKPFLLPVQVRTPSFALESFSSPAFSALTKLARQINPTYNKLQPEKPL